MVGKSGIHKNVGFGVTELVDHGKNLLYLRPGGQIAAVKSVKMQPKRGKMGRDGRKLVAQIQMGIAGKFARMCGKQRRGDHRRVHARRRKNGQRHCQRAAPYTGKIMHRQRPFLHGRVPPFIGMTVPIIHKISKKASSTLTAGPGCGIVSLSRFLEGAAGK